MSKEDKQNQFVKDINRIMSCQNRQYRIIITTPTHPSGVSYPGTGYQLYTRKEAIAYLRDMVKRGRPSNHYSDYGAYAEGNSERFTLEDIDSK